MDEQISVLIVDDSKGDLFLLESLFAEYFPEITIFKTASAQDGLAVAAHRHVDGALIDVRLPGMDGIEMCRSLKSTEKTRDISIILLTSYEATPKLRARGLEAGADDFIHRPFENIEFVARVKVMLRAKRAEEALRDSEEKFQTIISNTQAIIFNIDKDGIFQLSEGLGLASLGLEPGQVVGISAFEFYKNFPAIIKGIKEALNGRLYRDIIDVDGAFFDIFYSPYRDSQGDVVGLLGMAFDITERKRAEEAGVRLTTAIEQAAEAIVITDGEGTIQYLNPAFENITGYARAEALGRNLRMLKSGKHDDDFYKKLWETITRGEVWRGHFFNKKKDGSLYEEEATISPITDAAGSIINFVAVKRDVTLEVALEQQLRQAQKMEAIGSLAAGVAHDFNNILCLINGFAEMVMTSLGPRDPLYADVAEIHNAGRRAAALVAQLLAFSRKQVIAPRVLQPNGILDQSRKMLERIIGEDIELVFIPDKELGHIKADPAQLDQILVNLAVNARDAMPGGGKLTIETQNVTFDEEYCRSHTGAKPGNFVMLAVSDNGQGMDEDTKRHIFEPFFSTKERGRGTGLGLSTVYGIVKQNEGFISVYSEVGVETSFKVYFPRVEEEAEEIRKQGIKIYPTGTETVLIVEDDEMVRRLAGRVLEKQGYRIINAEAGGQAIELARTHHGEIHLLLTDVVMPTMDGAKLYVTIKETRPEIKCLFMSGYPENVIADHGVLVKGTNFIPKPFNIETLMVKVREVLDDRGGA